MSEKRTEVTDLFHESHEINTDTDSDLYQKFVSQAELRENTRHYAKILEAYSSTLKDSLISKLIMKRFFCISCVCILIIVAVTFIVVLHDIVQAVINNPDKSYDIASIATVITAMSTAFIASFMYIPNLIVKYLFNLKEDENMLNLIQNNQKYVMSVIEKVQKTKEQSK